MTSKFPLIVIKILNKQPVRNVSNMTFNGAEFKNEIVKGRHYYRGKVNSQSKCPGIPGVKINKKINIGKLEKTDPRFDLNCNSPICCADFFDHVGIF